MARLIVLCERPHHLTRGEAGAWLCQATANLRVGDGAIEALRLVELESASTRWARCWDWLLEVQLVSADAATELVCQGAFSDLLADLRLLGMRPAVAVANPARTMQLGTS